MKKKPKTAPSLLKIQAPAVLGAIPLGVSTVETLGRRSHFIVTRDRNGIMITNSGKSSQLLTEAHLDAVCRRYTSLLKSGRQHMASEYVDPNWPERPSRIFSPYVASIVRWRLASSSI
jgi:hypothetical protein